jgi:hypothetical protein
MAGFGYIFAVLAGCMAVYGAGGIAMRWDAALLDQACIWGAFFSAVSIDLWLLPW